MDLLSNEIDKLNQSIIQLEKTISPSSHILSNEESKKRDKFYEKFDKNQMLLFHSTVAIIFNKIDCIHVLSTILVKSGIGKLILIAPVKIIERKDAVNVGILMEHVGLSLLQVLRLTLLEINPYLQIVTHDIDFEDLKNYSLNSSRLVKLLRTHEEEEEDVRGIKSEGIVSKIDVIISFQESHNARNLICESALECGFPLFEFSYNESGRLGFEINFIIPGHTACLNCHGSIKPNIGIKDEINSLNDSRKNEDEVIDDKNNFDLQEEKTETITNIKNQSEILPSIQLTLAGILACNCIKYILSMERVVSTLKYNSTEAAFGLEIKTPAKTCKSSRCLQRQLEICKNVDMRDI